MNECALLGQGLKLDNILSIEDPGNRDGCYEPYVFLAQRFRDYGYALHTRDIIKSQPVFEIHMDVNVHTSNVPAFLLLLETPAIQPSNSEVPSQYRKVFTWDDTRVDGNRFIKINFPNPLAIPDVDGFGSRDRFCCLIAGNKTVAQSDSRELYSERVKTIRWFEKNAPQDFDLYGIDWEYPPLNSGVSGKVIKRLWKYIPGLIFIRPFPSYRGRVDRKYKVLSRTRFSICYENVRDMPGYITEKIFDCFFAGCIPVYWGASNVDSHIPADCFIDRRKFRDTEQVYGFLKSINEEDFVGYQKRIAEFLESDNAYPFSSEYFAETIASTIVRDLGS